VTIAAYILAGLAAYLLGSLPTGFLLGKARGIDIRSVGSGNIGATNVFRTIGTRAGILVFAIDGLKGWLAVRVVSIWIVQRIAPSEPGEGVFQFAAIVAGICAVLGHNYTCWLRFKGGKGIATSAGVLVALVPWALLIGLGIWLVLLLAARYVSLASIGASFALPFATWFTTRDWVLTCVTAGLGVLAIYRHQSNIRRLLDGTESRVTTRKRGGMP
jgi:acyl phosphate:glycerol-3-phosphate acyltransferase